MATAAPLYRARLRCRRRQRGFFYTRHAVRLTQVTKTQRRGEPRRYLTCRQPLQPRRRGPLRSPAPSSVEEACKCKQKATQNCQPVTVVYFYFSCPIYENDDSYYPTHQPTSNHGNRDRQIFQLQSS